MSTQHTPTPWHVDNDSGRLVIRDADACTIARIEPRAVGAVPSAQDAAAIIVRACNNHDALVAAVRIELAALIEQRDTGTTMLSRDARIARMRAALAAVEGK